MKSDNCNNGCDHNDDYDCVIDDCSDSESDSELEDSNFNYNLKNDLQSANNHTTLLKQMSNGTIIDDTVIQKNLHHLKFRSK